eukprot:5446396-Karenia_brevis.AAC.1
MDGVTEFHFIGTDDAPAGKKLKFGEHKGKMFSEVTKNYPEYSRKFDGTKNEKIPAYCKEYL